MRIVQAVEMNHGGIRFARVESDGSVFLVDDEREASRLRTTEAEEAIDKLTEETGGYLGFFKIRTPAAEQRRASV